MGEALTFLGKPAESLPWYERALALCPHHAVTHFNLGCALRGNGESDEAVACFERALALNPEFADAHLNLGVTLHEVGRPAAGIAHFDTALRLRPGWPKAKLSRGISHLALGNYSAGWKDYEARGEVHPQIWRPWGLPRWNGNPAPGQTLRAYGEQGVGTELMFASCLHDAAAAVHHLVVQCDPRLVRLLARSYPKATVAPNTTAGDKWLLDQGVLPDMEIPMGSLPGIYRRSDRAFVGHPGYLTPDPLATLRWRKRLGDGFKVGVSWRGGGDEQAAIRRCAPIDDWEELLRVPGVRWVNLQYGPNRELIDVARGRWQVVIQDLDGLDPGEDLDDLTGVLSALDLVISVSNSTVHLAGAVGTPVWNLLSEDPDWRWMAGNRESIWHPSVTLFRQPQRGDWGPMFKLATARLRALAASQHHRHGTLTYQPRVSEPRSKAA